LIAIRNSIPMRASSTKHQMQNNKITNFQLSTVDLAQNHLLCRLMSTYGTTHS